MKKWTISKRVTVGFAAVIATAIALGLFALLKILRIENASLTITRQNIPGLEAVGRAAKLATANRLLIYKHISSASKEDMQAMETQIADQRKEIGGLLDQLEMNVASAEGRRLLEVLKAARHAYVGKSEEVMVMSRADADAKKTYAFARAELDPLAAKYNSTLDDVIRFEMDEAAHGAQNIGAAVQGATWGIVIGVIVAALIGVSVGIGIVQGTSRVLHSVSASIDEAASQVASAANQVSESSQTLASGSSEQAASLEETSASLEEMASMTKRNAESAVRAMEVSNKMRAAAEAGASDMQEMNRAMEAIKGSSDEISKIVKTIDEIAFQTNILALNAAVEAARAGEAGMGFAVVADEVRSLAQRSAQSAKETAAKIEGSVTRSEHGVRVSQKVSQSLSEILVSARESDTLVAEITQASKEQEQGIQQLNTAVAQMDKVTQTNASTAEETASAAEELNAQAATQKEAIRELIALVGRSTRDTMPKIRARMSKEASHPSRASNGHESQNGRTQHMNGNGRILTMTQSSRPSLIAKGLGRINGEALAFQDM